MDVFVNEIATRVPVSNGTIPAIAAGFIAAGKYVLKQADEEAMLIGEEICDNIVNNLMMLADQSSQEARPE